MIREHERDERERANSHLAFTMNDFGKSRKQKRRSSTGLSRARYISLNLSSVKCKFYTRDLRTMTVSDTTNHVLSKSDDIVSDRPLTNTNLSNGHELNATKQVHSSRDKFNL